MVKGVGKKRFLRSKSGSESVETGLVSIGLLLIGAVLVVIFVMISSSIFQLFHKKEAQSTGESFKFLVSKVEKLNEPAPAGLSKVDHAYYIQSGYYLFGFDKEPDAILYRDGTLVKPPKCGSSEACLCVCDTKDCNKESSKVIDCNINIDGKRVNFDNIEVFNVTGDDKNEFTQGSDIKSGQPAGGKFLAIYGKWGGVCPGCGIGFGCHCWAPGTLMRLERKGSMIEVTFP
ncbi:hypothetical protein HYV83_05075 [Candidatus Woesearchaeota archaeon]|nr:hypothetical protein [Candidatus Woesearchaeota archaeon]